MIGPIKKGSESGKLSKEAKEVMNLPDQINNPKKDPSSTSKTAHELIEENKMKQKKDALNRVNNKLPLLQQKQELESNESKQRSTY